MPNTLALIAVQRQTAASRSTRSWMRGQQGVFGGVPKTTLSKFFNTLAQTPSLRASLGHVALSGGLGLGLGFGGGCLGVFGGGGQAGVWFELTIVKKRRFRERSKAQILTAFEAICVTKRNYQDP